MKLKVGAAGCGFFLALLMATAAQAAIQIAEPAGTSPMGRLAARELARYIYLRTGRLPAALAQTGRVVVARRGQPTIDDPAIRAAAAGLKAQQFILRTTPGENGAATWWIVGGDDQGTLFGAYRFCELLGVRFYLHGDVIPDEPLGRIPEMNETGKPLFGLRGLNPWGSHPFGFDQWSVDDYKAIFAQITKMRMNFLGIHCYPEGQPYAEPTVWLGLKNDVDTEGRVRASYPSHYYNTAVTGKWGPIPPRKTGEYSCGGAQLFENDDWGPDVMRGLMPEPATPEACNELFNRTGAQFKDAFGFARQLGVKTCVGTETPLVMPAALRERLQKEGKKTDDPAVVREIYEGMFRRIEETHALDYYWLWTPEKWTWRGNDAKQLSDTIADVKLAMEALKNVGAPFALATSGWVLGPADDRAAFDAVLPKSIPMSALSRRIGYDPVDPAYGRIKGREKWAIPWLEGDGGNGIAAVQLWVGRTRQDAALALAYGCTGLLGLQWRTEILAPNVAALAQAGWSQSGWNPRPGDVASVEPPALVQQEEGAIGGQIADFTRRKVEIKDAPVYLTCRYNMQGFRFKIPNGDYRVTLKFCEPTFSNANQRVCDVRLQGKTVIEGLDIFAKVGKFKPYDETIENVRVSNGLLSIDFVNRVSMACVSGIVIEGGGFTKKLNCGGPAWQDYLADSRYQQENLERGLPANDFYADWARASFGPEAAAGIAAIFTKIDGKVPASVARGCPSGTLAPDRTPWDKVAEDFNCVAELEALRPGVQGAGNLERFDTWLNTLRYHRDLGRIRCALGEFEGIMKQVDAGKNAARRKALAATGALPAYQKIVSAWEQAYCELLATVGSNGALAMVVNMENHAGFRPLVIDEPARRLEAALGTPLPGAALPSKDYQGAPRLIVPTVRSLLARGEALKIHAIVLDKNSVDTVALYWRPLGPSEFKRLEMKHAARGVFGITLPPPPAQVEAFEYYLEVREQKGTVCYPVTAPKINQTIVIMGE